MPEADEELFPGHKDLDDEAKENLETYTKNLTENVLKEVNKNPAIAFAQRLANESKFDKALNVIIGQYPDLANSKDEFKSKYFNPNNTPDNIEKILGDTVKIHLYDRAKDHGAEEERKRNETRIDQERANGGNNEVVVSNRTMEDWERMARTDPQKFANLSKEYEEDMRNGKLAE